MITLGIAVTLAIRVVLVLLFLPFSALDKLLNFNGAIAQATEVTANRFVAVGLIVVGLRRSVHVVGYFDRRGRPRLRLRTRRLLCRNGTPMEAILEARRLLEIRYRARQSAVLGFSQEFRSLCGLSTDYIRNRCRLGAPFHCASHGVLSSLSCQP